MGKRGTVVDYAGEPLYRGDLITYSTRCGNRVRASDAIIAEKPKAVMVGGRLTPMLKVQPTGVDSGYGLGERKTLRTEWISPEHVRLLRSNVTGEQREDH
ncbi:hypothetical protein [Streptomyces sp. NPDC059874]|uniref:hypothetical protein n=1 Tax=Streptomyces sp. NPDC059874 TaxID=3346983 RepID=UPI003653CCB9